MINQPHPQGIATQATIQTPVICSGQGVHTGGHSRLELLPGDAHQGIVFEVDQQGRQGTIVADVDHVLATHLCTSLSDQGVTVHTVEHLLAAVYALGITNLVIRVQGYEVPMNDGSSYKWVQLLKQAGMVIQPCPALTIQITQPIRVDSSSTNWCELTPADSYQLMYDLHFDHPLLQQQHTGVDLSASVFEEQISWARTFGFLADIQTLHEQRLALGANLDNVLVFDHTGVVNPDGMRSPDEPTRHKILDAIGDLSLLGARIQGKFVGHHSGHALNHQLSRALRANPQSWRWL